MQSDPLVRISPGQHREAGPKGEGTIPPYTFFKFTHDCAARAREIADEELLNSLGRSGAFDWLDHPEEDVYTLNDGEPL